MDHDPEGRTCSKPPTHAFTHDSTMCTVRKVFWSFPSSSHTPQLFDPLIPWGSSGHGLAGATFGGSRSRLKKSKEIGSFVTSKIIELHFQDRFYLGPKLLIHTPSGCVWKSDIPTCIEIFPYFMGYHFSQLKLAINWGNDPTFRHYQTSTTCPGACFAAQG